MTFSIIVPVYNAIRYIEETVTHLMQTQCGDFEVMLVDDGSTDGSGDICDRLSERYPQTVRVLHQTNQGQLAARWHGIRNAAGTYCLFLDADDALTENSLSEMQSMLEKYAEPDLLIYSYEYAYADGTVRRADKLTEGEAVYSDKSALYPFFFTGILLNPVWTKSVKREVLLRQTVDIDKYTVLRCAEDRLFSMEIVTQAQTVVYCDCRWYQYRLTPDSVTRQFTPRAISRFNETVLYDVTRQYMTVWGMDTNEWVERYGAQAVGSTVHTFNQFYESVRLSERRDVLRYDWARMLPAAVSERIADNPYINQATKRYWTWIVKKNGFRIAWAVLIKQIRKKQKARKSTSP